jgi:oligoendopeptidase F
MKTKWDLTLLYDSLDDARIERDVTKTEREYKKFNRDFSNTDTWLKSSDALLKALKRGEALYNAPGHKALYYAHYITELDSSNSKAEALKMRIQDRLTKAGTLIIFFENRLSNISKDKQRVLLSDKRLAKYKYYLKTLFNEGKYMLTEEQEKVLSLVSAPGGSMWCSGVERLINKQVIKLGKDSMPINEALGKTPYLKSAKSRRAWHNATLERLKDISDFPESEMNALYTKKKVMDDLRGFKESYDATILSYENNKKSVLALVDTVTDSFNLVHKFMRIKRDMLGLQELQYADRSAPVGDISKEVPFREASKIVQDAFNEVGIEYGDIYKSLLDNGQVDVYPKIGKSGGAYCSSGTNMPTFLLLNHTDDLNSLYTLAHEMGHAMHSELSKSQGVLYESYSTAVAETASTFFERVVFDKVFNTLTDKEKIIALHNKVQDDIATIFRQIAFFNFELELHSTIREQGWVPKEQIAKILQKHLQAYLGKSVSISELDGYSFVYIGHFRRYFYVYSYAFGQLISGALFEKYKQDNTYITKIKQFLSAGGSDTPENIFKKIGIDVTKPEFWKEGLNGIERDIKTLAKLIK